MGALGYTTSTSKSIDKMFELNILVRCNHQCYYIETARCLLQMIQG